MDMMIRWYFLIFAALMVHSAEAAEVSFFSGNLSSAKKLAAEEGKLYFAEFTASWCAACRQLEEITFTDQEVVKYVAKYYIPVKVDIDDFDGMAMKQVYNVEAIPTIIIFNSKGQLLEKTAEGLPPSKMLALLKKHNTAGNRIQARPASNPPAFNHNKQKLPAAHSPMKSSITKPDKKPSTPVRVTEYNSAPKPPSPQGAGLYRFKVSQQDSKGYSVQVGAFREYGNVLRETARMQAMIDTPVIVHIAQYGDSTIYKILVGEFPSSQEAIQFQSQMKKKGVEGVIKDLSTLQ